MIFIPAETYPFTVIAAGVPADTRIENTNNNLVSVVTEIFNDSVEALKMLPAAILPTNIGVKLNAAIAEKLLVRSLELYIFAIMETVDPANVDDSVDEKRVLNPLIVPLLGIEKAKFNNNPVLPVRSIIASAG